MIARVRERSCSALGVCQSRERCGECTRLYEPTTSIPVHRLINSRFEHHTTDRLFPTLRYPAGWRGWVRRGVEFLQGAAIGLAVAIAYVAVLGVLAAIGVALASLLAQLR